MKNKIYLILIGLFSTFFLLGILGAFTTSFVLPNFPYKMQNISTNIKNANVNNTSIKNYLSIDKEGQLKTLQENLDKAKKNAEDSTKQLNEFSIPEKLDAGSMLIFLEQFALKNYLQLLNIQFNEQGSTQNMENPDNLENLENPNNVENQEEKVEEKPEENIERNHQNQLVENNPNNQEDPNATTQEENVPMEQSNTPSINGLNSKKVTVKVMGPYAHIQVFLETLPNELGFFNNIDNLKIWKSTEQNALYGVNSWDQYLFEDEKSVILEFDIISYHR